MSGITFHKVIDSQLGINTIIGIVSEERLEPEDILVKLNFVNNNRFSHLKPGKPLSSVIRDGVGKDLLLNSIRIYVI